MKFNEKLQKLRKEKHMSQESLAERPRIFRQAISKWETGDALPDTDNAVELARVFGVSRDYLLREEETDR